MLGVCCKYEDRATNYGINTLTLSLRQSRQQNFRLNVLKNAESKPDRIENYKTRGQTV